LCLVRFIKVRMRVDRSRIQYGVAFSRRVIDRFYFAILGFIESNAMPLYLISNSPIVTGPVARFARQIASQGYIVAAPSSYHEFTGPEPLAYDGPGTDAGNEWKIAKKVEAYDEDATLSIDTLLALPTCNGRIGATGTSSRDSNSSKS
jgi:hypothetical protein